MNGGRLTTAERLARIERLLETLDTKIDKEILDTSVHNVDPGAHQLDALHTIIEGNRNRLWIIAGVLSTVVIIVNVILAILKVT